MSLPVFKAAEPPLTYLGRRTMIDETQVPRCKTCGDAGPVDAETGWCRPCFRVLAALPVVLAPVLESLSLEDSNPTSRRLK